MRKPRTPIKKRNVAIAVLVLSMLTAPVVVGYRYIEPLIFRPAQQLIKRIPVAYVDLTPIPVKYKAIRNIPVRVIPKGANSGLRVTFKDTSKIKVVRKSYGQDGLPEVEGISRVQTRHVRSRGLQPQRPTD